MPGRREFVKTGLAAMIGLTAAQHIPSISPLEVQAQAAQEPREKEFDMLWKQAGDRYIVKKPYSNGIVLEQQVATGDPNYKAVFTYTGRVGKDGKLSEWEVVANLYATSDPSKPDSQMSTSGRVEPNGKFSMDVWKLGISGLGDLSTAVRNSVLISVMNGTPELVNYWVTDTTKKYEALKVGQNLEPLPRK